MQIYKAIKYIRLSYTDDKTVESDSVANQRRLIDDFIEKHPEIEVIGEKIDDGYSGVLFDRPAFQEMMQMIKEGEVNCVIVKDLSRLGREYIETGRYMRRVFPAYGVRFIAINDNVDTANDAPDELTVSVKNIMNEAYCRDISIKTRSALEVKRRSGDFVGAFAMYGYLKTGDKHKSLEIDPYAANVVRDIFRKRLEGFSASHIADELNRLGVLSPLAYKRNNGLPHAKGGYTDRKDCKWSATTIIRILQDETYTGTLVQGTPSNYKESTGEITSPGLIGSGKWQTRTVMKILQSEVYTGDLVQGKTKIMDHRQVKAENDNLIIAQGTHEAIVSHEMFEAVQAYRKEICEESKAKPKKPYTPNIFKGKVFCAHCGRSLHRQRAERKKGPDIYWFHCLTKSRVDRDGCIGVAVQESELMVTVTSILEKELSVALGMSVPLLQLETKHQKEQDALKSRMLLKRQEIEKYRRLVRGLYENFVQGVLTSEEYFTMKADYEEKIKSVSSEITELENEVEQLMGRLEQYRAMEQDAQTLERNHALTAELIERLIDRIEITHDRDIHVAFRFQSEFATQEKEADLCEAM